MPPLPDIRLQFLPIPRWRSGRFEYEGIRGELGEPGKVATFDDPAARTAVSKGTGERAGHRIARKFGAPCNASNLSLQNPNINTYAPKALQEGFQGKGGSYYDLECVWEAKLHLGYRIHVTVLDRYRAGEKRPISREVSWIETDPKGNVISYPTRSFGNFSSPQERAAKAK
jgi:hypothetical protein